MAYGSTPDPNRMANPGSAALIGRQTTGFTPVQPTGTFSASGMTWNPAGATWRPAQAPVFRPAAGQKTPSAARLVTPEATKTTPVYTGAVQPKSGLKLTERLQLGTAGPLPKAREYALQKMGFKTLQDKQGNLLVDVDGKVYYADEPTFSFGDVADWFGERAPSMAGSIATQIPGAIVGAKLGAAAGSFGGPVGAGIGAVIGAGLGGAYGGEYGAELGLKGREKLADVMGISPEGSQITEEELQSEKKYGFWGGMFAGAGGQMLAYAAPKLAVRLAGTDKARVAGAQLGLPSVIQTGSRAAQALTPQTIKAITQATRLSARQVIAQELGKSLRGAMAREAVEGLISGGAQEAAIANAEGASFPDILKRSAFGAGVGLGLGAVFGAGFYGAGRITGALRGKVEPDSSIIFGEAAESYKRLYGAEKASRLLKAIVEGSPKNGEKALEEFALATWVESAFRRSLYAARAEGIDTAEGVIERELRIIERMKEAEASNRSYDAVGLSREDIEIGTARRIQMETAGPEGAPSSRVTPPEAELPGGARVAPEGGAGTGEIVRVPEMPSAGVVPTTTVPGTSGVARAIEATTGASRQPVSGDAAQALVERLERRLAGQEAIQAQLQSSDVGMALLNARMKQMENDAAILAGRGERQAVDTQALIDQQPDIPLPKPADSTVLTIRGKEYRADIFQTPYQGAFAVRLTPSAATDYSQSYFFGAVRMPTTALDQPYVAVIRQGQTELPIPRDTYTGALYDVSRIIGGQVPLGGGQTGVGTVSPARVIQMSLPLATAQNMTRINALPQAQLRVTLARYLGKKVGQAFGTAVMMPDVDFMKLNPFYDKLITDLANPLRNAGIIGDAEVDLLKWTFLKYNKDTTGYRMDVGKFNTELGIADAGNFQPRPGETMLADQWTLGVNSADSMGYAKRNGGRVRTFFHEFGHLGHFTILDDTERASVQSLWKRFMDDPNLSKQLDETMVKLRGQKNYDYWRENQQTWLFGKNHARSPIEFFAETFSLWMMGKKLKQAADLDPSFVKVSQELTDYMSSLLAGGSIAALDELEPIFERVIAGSSTAKKIWDPGGFSGPPGGMPKRREIEKFLRVFRRSVAGRRRSIYDLATPETNEGYNSAAAQILENLGKEGEDIKNSFVSLADAEVGEGSLGALSESVNGGAPTDAVEFYRNMMKSEFEPEVEKATKMALDAVKQMDKIGTDEFIVPKQERKGIFGKLLEKVIGNDEAYNTLIRVVAPIKVILESLGPIGKELNRRGEEYLTRQQQYAGRSHFAIEKLKKTWTKAGASQREELIGLLEKNGRVALEDEGRPGQFYTVEELQGLTNDNTVKQMIAETFDATQEISDVLYRYGLKAGGVTPNKPAPFNPHVMVDKAGEPWTEEAVMKQVRKLIAEDPVISKVVEPDRQMAMAMDRVLGSKYSRGARVFPMKGREMGALTMQQIGAMNMKTDLPDALTDWADMMSKTAAKLDAFGDRVSIYARGEFPDVGIDEIVNREIDKMKNELLIEVGRRYPNEYDAYQSYLLGDRQVRRDVTEKIKRPGAVDLLFGERPELNKLVTRVMQMNLFKLGLSPIVNVAGGTVNNLLATNPMTWMRGIMKAVVNIHNALGIDSQFQQWARRSGAQEAGLYEAETGSLKGWLKKYLKVFNVTEQNWNRALSAYTGALSAEDLAKTVVNGRTPSSRVYAARQLAELLNTTPAEITERLSRRGLQNVDVAGTTLSTRLTEQELLDASNRFTRKTQFGYHPQNLPLWFQSPAARVFTQFKSYSYQQLRFVMGQSILNITEGIKGKNNAQVMHGVRNLVALGTIVPLSGATVVAITNVITGNDKPNDLTTIDGYLNSIANLAGFGVLGDAIQAAGRGPSGLAEWAAGPTAGTASEIAYRSLDMAQDIGAGDFGSAGQSAFNLLTRQFGGLGSIARNVAGTNTTSGSTTYPKGYFK